MRVTFWKRNAGDFSCFQTSLNVKILTFEKKNLFIWQWKYLFFKMFLRMILEFLHPSLILPVFFLSPPSASFFSSSLWTAYCGILKVHSRVLSCPLLPSMHRSNLELLSAQDGRTLLMSGRWGGGEIEQTLRCCFMYSLIWFHRTSPAAVINLKDPHHFLFSSFSFPFSLAMKLHK